jgi:hypothetical protein
VQRSEKTKSLLYFGGGSFYFPTASVMPNTPVVTLGALAPENGET